MRLICPNCDAQYEVPTEVIPADGRDVQCSNCGDTWFQTHPDNEGASSNDGKTSKPVPSAVDKAEAGIGQVKEVFEDDEPDSIAPEPVARELDPSVVDILRKEAEYETQQRMNEQSAGLEIQPDLGLQEAEDDAGRRAREARERMPQVANNVPDRTDSMIAQTLGSRRDLLPDVEEISSSLRSDSDIGADIRGGADTYLEVDADKRGFRWGFTLIVLLAVILVGVYIMAPKIAQSVPTAEPTISKYVAFVDGGRDALSSRVKGILDWLDAKASSSTP